MKNRKVIISGGGTGGHIFPAISIANALKLIDDSIQILFVGAEGRMEMEKVPAAGYNIIGLPVSGFIRKLTLNNIKVIWRLLISLKKAAGIIDEFKPDAVVGVGGYASGPLLKKAVKKGIPALLQEQNSYAGVTNKLLASKVDKICVAYDNMDKYFPAEKIIITGNPVRQDLLKTIEKGVALSKFGFNANSKTVLILGGSLGARSINNSVIKNIDLIKKADIQFIWQTGKIYFQSAKEACSGHTKNLYVTDFIKDMAAAYAAADIVISRAGAGTISELSLLGKPCILVPSPNVAEDHQTKNALALVNKKAALLVRDAEAENHLLPELISLANNNKMLNELKENILKLAMPNSSEIIAKEVIKLFK